MQEIGRVTDNIKSVLGITEKASKIVISGGLRKHLVKRKHENVLPYFDNITEIIHNPDYIGVNPNINNTSLEYIKCYDDNVLVAVKLDKTKDYFYVATMHELSKLKITKRLHSGRLKKLTSGSRHVII